MTAAGVCVGCADPLAGGGDPPAGGDVCPACGDARATTVLDTPPTVPLAVAAPGADLGTIDGLHQRLLAVDVWPDTTTLRVAVGGPGWIDREPFQPRGRWALTDATGRTTTALMASFGGNDGLGIGDVPLPAASLDALPWTVALHRAGEDRQVTVEAARPLRPVAADVSGDVSDPLPPPDAATCRSCGAPSGPDRPCDACRAATVAVLEAHHASAGATPLTEPLALDARRAGLGCFLSLERWPGSWTVRHHLAREWDARDGGLRGRWRAEVGTGPPVDGAAPHRSGSARGFTEDVTFPGALDPTATVVSLTLVRSDTVVARVDLPVNPL